MSYGKSLDFLLNQMRNGTGSLASGTLTFYYPGTTTLKNVYLDRTLETTAANPYTLSADGTAELFADGIYRIVVKDSTGVIVYDYDNVGLTDPVNSGSTTTCDKFSGDGIETKFTLSSTPLSIACTQVFVSGVYVSKDLYTLTNDTITFLTPPAIGVDNVEIVNIGSPVITEHSALTGLDHDDHPQYMSITQHAAVDHTGVTGVPTQYTNEMAQDAVGAAIAAGTQTGITVTYDDVNNKIDFEVTSGSGDVSGPASATDGHVVLFDGSTGKLVKDSGLTLSGINTGDQDLSGYATIASLATVATSGSYTDLSNTPAIPTQYTDEMAQDAVGTLITNGTQSGITVTYDDANNKIDFTVTASGSGDVIGPASAVSNNVAVFDGITGKLIKDSGVAVHDPVTVADSTSIDLTLTGQQISADAIFGTTAGTVCQGNDSRLSDARTPTSHDNTYHSETYITSAALSGLLDETAHDLLDHTGLTGVPAAYSLPTASTTVLGGVKIDGTTITISDGVISSAGGSSSFLDVLSVTSVSSITYNADGSINVVTYATNSTGIVTATMGYTSGDLTTVTYKNGGGTTLYTATYTYTSGNVTAVTWS